MKNPKIRKLSVFKVFEYRNTIYLSPVIIDDLENVHADRTTNYMFWAITEAEGAVGIP